MKLVKIDENQLSVGDRLNFNAGVWKDGAAIVRPADCEYLCIGQFVKLVNWRESGPPDVISAKPGKDLPDARELNEKVPREEWGLDLAGKPRPPWQHWRVVVLLDIVNAALFSYGNSTFGTMIAFDQLAQRVEIMRALQGAEVFAVVKLCDALMKTAFGDKRRPFFDVVGWRRFDGGALRVVDQSQNALRAIAPPTLSEEARDAIPF
jgi:hypothetical protein